MKIKVMGCSGGIGTGLRTTCVRVDEDILIDAGTGLGDLSLDEMARIQHIFLTHSHLDHICGVPLMVDSVFGRLTEPVVVYGREETIAALKEHVFNWVIWPDFSELPSTESPVLRFEIIQPGQVTELDGRRIEMIAVNHAVPGAGYRIEDSSGVFAFSGDTTTNDTFWRALNNYPRLDALMVECAFLDRARELTEKAYHYCPSMLAADLQKLRHRPQIFISHLNPGDEQEIMVECRKLLPDFQVHQLRSGDDIPLMAE
ncbi:MAG: 3',5'-cyclic-nucleotide phosphodiesterase [Gammaproteobacteria bacterium]